MNSNEINNHTSGQRETLAEKAARLNQKAGPDREFHDDDPVGKPAKSRKPVKGVRYEDIDPTIDLDALTWSWRNRIPRGLCLLTGREGAGKSGATDWLAYHYSTGATWPDGQPCEAGTVLLFDSENSPERKLIKLRAIGCDMAKVEVFDVDRVKATGLFCG